MNSSVIKVVAGGGKTTESEAILKRHSNGLYLAFNQSVVKELRLKGYMCKTIDSLFSSYIIPKLISLVPLINDGSIVCYQEVENLPINLKGIGNITIDERGNIYNKGALTKFNLDIPHYSLREMKREKNYSLINYIFSEDKLQLTHRLRSDLSSYLIHKFSQEIIFLLKSRFSYVIFDEAQDLNKHLELLAKSIYESEIKSYFLGDEYQNINGGGCWFEGLSFTKKLLHFYRCPENNCKWIRDELNIEIYGEDRSSSGVNRIKIEKTMQYDDGNRVLLYAARRGKDISSIIDSWKGNKMTIKSAKGRTLEHDIVIVGISLNYRLYYTAITRTKKSVYTTIEKINFSSK